MKQNNIWYLDRGKNFFTQEGKIFFEEMISIFNALSIYKNLSSNDIIEKFPNKYKESGNPNALLTTLRNIGIVNKQNELAQNAKEYLDYRLSYEELILENLSKINYDKDNEYTVKPFFIICIVLYELYLINSKYSLITKMDCIKYLYDIKEYDKTSIFNMIQKMILDDRDYTNVKEAVLDIWFNALNNFKFFDSKDKNVLAINEEQVDFFKVIYNIYYSGNYEKFNDGIYGCIPVVEIENKVKGINIKKIDEYLFGVEKYTDIEERIGTEYFGIYKPFALVKNLAYRRIKENNPNLAEELYRTNEIESFDDTVVNSEDNLNYLDSFISIIKEGRVNTTYKLVLAKAIVLNIADIIDNKKVNNVINYRDISKVFVEHYWNEIINGHTYQSYGGKSKAIEIIEEFQEEFQEEYKENNLKEYFYYKEIIESYDLFEYVLKKFNSLLNTDVIYRFVSLSNVDKGQISIYQYDTENKSLTFNREDMYAIYNHKDELLKIIEERNEEVVADMNANNIANVIDAEEKSNSFITQKNDAEIFLKSKNIDLSGKDWTYAKKQPNKKCYWMNPPSYLVEKDWYIVLNNQDDSKIIVLIIPRNTLEISDNNDRRLS